MRAQRKTEWVTNMDKNKSEEMRQRLGVCGVFEKIETQQLRLFGHMVKTDEEGTPKATWEMGMRSISRPGRSREIWNNELASS